MSLNPHFEVKATNSAFKHTCFNHDGDFRPFNPDEERGFDRLGSHAVSLTHLSGRSVVSCHLLKPQCNAHVEKILF